MATVNGVLKLGALAEDVEVIANAAMVSSGSATMARTLDQKELESLPTSGRNFSQLLVIEPGVSADISELLSNDNASISPSVNGARTTNNSFVFNGVDVTSLLCCNSRVNDDRGTLDEGGGTLSRNVAPALETLQEVKLQTSLYDAATGRNGGGNFQIVSKSGTNKLAGTAYYYHQNDNLMANDFFFNRANLDRPLLRRHEGGSPPAVLSSGTRRSSSAGISARGHGRHSSTRRATPFACRAISPMIVPTQGSTGSRQRSGIRTADR